MGFVIAGEGTLVPIQQNPSQAARAVSNQEFVKCARFEMYDEYEVPGNVIPGILVPLVIHE